jgi:phosphatidylglycerophosphatase A
LELSIFATVPQWEKSGKLQGFGYWYLRTMYQQWIRLNLRFMLSHPAHCIALGFGSGLSRIAPGTVGTLWAWVTFVLLSPWMNDWAWGIVLLLSLPIGWWACSVTAQHLEISDPSGIVWDEIVAFWLILWLVTPSGWAGQLGAFVVFRLFDAIKIGPVAWADNLFHPIDPHFDPAAWRKAGFGIMLDDLVAAGCTLLVIALWRSHF